ncbi:MAG: hypothetical protein P1V97_37670, partial [Planctomycetota bacterium]|nr:hypothetical protein [Planctomycetota bacterium]
AFDTENFARNHDNGVNGSESDLGVFAGSLMSGIYDGNRADSDSLLLFRTFFDPLSPFKANASDHTSIGVPLGNDNNDAIV